MFRRSLRRTVNSRVTDTSSCRCRSEVHRRLCGCRLPGRYGIISLHGVEIRNFSSNASGQPISSNTAQDTSPALSYTLIGNDACRPNPRPTAANDDLFAYLGGE